MFIIQAIMLNEKLEYNDEYLVKIEALAVVENTLYLFESTTQTLLPMKLTNSNQSFLLRDDNETAGTNTPSIYNTTNRILLAAGFSIDSIKIYLSQFDTYYTYLCVKTNDQVLDININIEDAFKIIDIYNTPLYINVNILIDEGIKLTKELLKNYV